MAYYDSRKLIEVLREQIVAVPQRCEGYKEELTGLLVKVMHLERDQIGRASCRERV